MNSDLNLIEYTHKGSIYMKFESVSLNSTAVSLYDIGHLKMEDDPGFGQEKNLKICGMTHYSIVVLPDAV